MEEVPVIFEKKKNCCGCSACYSVCPVNAIVMVRDEEGFVYPNINEEKCIRCNRCADVCVFKSAQKEKGYYI